MPYVGGLSGGDTPPRQIRTTGAGRPPFISKRQHEDYIKGAPFAQNYEMPFSPRNTGMSLDVIKPDDVPRGPVRYVKDYNASLMTQDIPLAQPALVHPASESGRPVPWKFLEKPEMPDIARTTAKTHYPVVHPLRPRNLSLTSADVDGAQPRRIGRNCEGRARVGGTVDPLAPQYEFASSRASTLFDPVPKGRDIINVFDIDGAAPSPAVPVRNVYGDPLKCEEEFRARRRKRTPRSQPPVQDAERKISHRSVNPLDPEYVVPLPCDTPRTSLHAQWGEERRDVNPHHPPVENRVIGVVHGSTPRVNIYDNGEAQLSLETCDIEGAAPHRRVGSTLYSMYGPPGQRPLQSTSLVTTDIEGAQAGTLQRGPKLPPKRSESVNAPPRRVQKAVIPSERGISRHSEVTDPPNTGGGDPT